MFRASLSHAFLCAIALAAVLSAGRAEAAPRIVAIREPENPLVAFRILFRSGSVDDPAGAEGATALAARMMSEGGTEKLTSSQLLEALFPMAGELGVYTDKEVTVFTGRVHKDHLDNYISILEDVILHPRWDEKEFGRLRDVQLSAIQNELRSNDDEDFGKEALEWLLYKGHPYGHPVDGTVAGVTSLDLARVKAHAKNVFTKNRLTVGLAGGFPESLPARLEKTFAALPEGPAPAAIPAPAPAPSPRVVIVEKDAPATAISMGYPYALGRTNPEFLPVWVGVSAFGEHRQSGGRLFQALREDRGLNYGDYAYAEIFRQAGFGTYPAVNIPRSRQQFSIWIRPVEHQNRVFAMRAALYEVDKLLKGGLADHEVSQARGFLDGYTRLWEMTTSRRLGFAIDDAVNGTNSFLSAARTGMGSLDTQRVNTALKKWVDPSQLRIAVITNDGAALKEALVSGAPSPISYPTPKSAEVMEEDKEIIKFPLRFKAEEVVVVKAEDMFEK